MIRSAAAVPTALPKQSGAVLLQMSLKVSALHAATIFSDSLPTSLALWLVLGGTQLKHPRQGIQRHLARLLLGSTLVEHARNLGDRDDDPAVVSLLMDDRQMQRALMKRV